MLHHNPVTDSLEAVLCLAFSGLQGVCRLCISPIPMHKVSAAPEPLEAAPLLGWRRSAGLRDLYIPGKPGMIARKLGRCPRLVLALLADGGGRVKTSGSLVQETT
jgi:hypothetical protein